MLPDGLFPLSDCLMNVLKCRFTTGAPGAVTLGVTRTMLVWSCAIILAACSDQSLTSPVSAAALKTASLSLQAAAPVAQDGSADQPISIRPAVRVLDGNNVAVGNVRVTFAVGSGSGSVRDSSVLTGADGIATVGSWTLGAAALQTLVASVAESPGKTLTFRATVPVSNFDIEVRFIGEGGTARQRAAFSAAITRWRRVIMGDMGTTPLNAAAGECQTWIPALDERVNDLLIFARIASIDGPGKTVGQASPCYVNSTTQLPIMGFFELDVDDLEVLEQFGTLDDVVLHEMGHVLGIGTLWNFERTLLVGKGGDDPYFSGIQARNAFAAVAGLFYTGIAVPVENTGTAGTRDAHWRRSVFANELMQGFAQPGGMPLSRITAASLADLGYTVLLTSSDSYSFFPSLQTMPAVGRGLSLGDDVAAVQMWEVDHAGRKQIMRDAE